MSLHPADLAITLVLALATAAISVSFTQGSVFEGLRQWIATKNALMGELSRCFFCLSHWVAFSGVAIYQPRPLQAWVPADFVVSAFVVVALATLLSGPMFGAFFLAGRAYLLKERLTGKHELVTR